MKAQFFKWCKSYAIILYPIITQLCTYPEIIYHVVADNELPVETSERGCFTQTLTSLERFSRMNQHIFF